MDIDVSDYFRVPNISLKLMRVLGTTLLRGRPEIEDLAIDGAAANLEAHLERVAQAFVARHVERTRELSAAELSFDRAVDSLWVTLRKILELEQVYAHAGFGQLPPERAEQADLPEARAHAQRAKDLHGRLFAAEGTKFVRAGFMDQSVTMASLLQLVEDDELGPQLEAVVGERMLRMVEVCQAHYEDVVDERLRRRRGLSEDLRELREELRWLIVQYNSAVVALLHDKSRLPLVEQALRPMVGLRRMLAAQNKKPEQLEDEAVDELAKQLEGDDEGEGG